MTKEKREPAEVKLLEKQKSLPSWERFSGVLPHFLSDEPLEDKRLSVMAGLGKDNLSRPCMTDEKTPTLAGITVKMREE